MTKSYVDTREGRNPLDTVLLIRDLLDKAHEQGLISELVNMETNEKITSKELLIQVSSIKSCVLTLISCTRSVKRCVFFIISKRWEMHQNFLLW